MKPKIVVLLILFILFIILIVQNSKPINVNLLFWTFEMSQIIVFFLVLLIGFVGGYFTARIEETKKTDPDKGKNSRVRN